MSSQTLVFILNILSVSLNVAGALLTFFNAPQVNSQLYIYTAAEMPEIQKMDARKNRRAQLGTIMLVLGCTLQLGLLFFDFVKKR
jgi:hypothetical protein